MVISTKKSKAVRAKHMNSSTFLFPGARGEKKRKETGPVWVKTKRERQQQQGLISVVIPTRGGLGRTRPNGQLMRREKKSIQQFAEDTIDKDR